MFSKDFHMWEYFGFYTFEFSFSHQTSNISMSGKICRARIHGQSVPRSVIFVVLTSAVLKFCFSFRRRVKRDAARRWSNAWPQLSLDHLKKSEWKVVTLRTKVSKRDHLSWITHLSSYTRALFIPRVVRAFILTIMFQLYTSTTCLCCYFCVNTRVSGSRFWRSEVNVCEKL